MSISTGFQVRPADKTDRHALASLTHFEAYVHRHLDWKSPLDWHGSQPYLVAEHNGRIVAALICPPDPPGVAWIRLFAASSAYPLSETWQALWRVAQEQLRQPAMPCVAAISLQRWFCELLEQDGFTHSHSVVVLAADVRKDLPEPKPASTIIRLMTESDLEAVRVVDAAAFVPIWQNSLEALQLAFAQSFLATVAQTADGLIGYQISTAGPMGAHLGRLAVQPGQQGRGIGYALVYDLLARLGQRNLLRATVNTQADNLASLSVYERAGFRMTGERYPVYQFGG